MRFLTLWYKTFFTVWIYFVAIDIRLIGVIGSTSLPEVQRYLELGVQMLAKGNLHDALAQFHAAIDGDPKNYVSYYRRATVFLALGRARSGLQDLNKVLQLKQDLTAARMQRASVHYKMGELDLAHVDLETVLRREPDNDEANHLYTSIEPLKQKMVIAKDDMTSGHYHQAIPMLKDIIDECPWAAWVRELRIKAYEAVEDLQSAISDLRVTTKLTADNTEGYLRLATLYYKMGDVEQALTEIRECLKLDPDHKSCFSLYKKVKKVNKSVSSLQENINNKEYAECVSNGKKILKDEPSIPGVRYIAHEKMCTCERETGDLLAAKLSCNSALEYTNDPRIFCERAEIHLINDLFDDASNDYQEALNIDEHYQRAREGMQKVQKLKKQAGKRNYYKILGVSKSATKKEVTKAYRSLAQKWHPDHYQEGDEKKMAQAKFIDIASAKEVLTDPEMRQKFDNGEDPLDPEAQQKSNFHQQGFNPFQHFHAGGGGGGGRRGGGEGGAGGGPFQFKFHF